MRIALFGGKTGHAMALHIRPSGTLTKVEFYNHRGLSLPTIALLGTAPVRICACMNVAAALRAGARSVDDMIKTLDRYLDPSQPIEERRRFERWKERMRARAFRRIVRRDA